MNELTVTLLKNAYEYALIADIPEFRVPGNTYPIPDLVNALKEYRTALDN